MRSRLLLILFAGLGSALSWWPALMRPTIDIPFEVAFASATLCATLPITLRPSIWLWLALASGLGTFGGLWVGFMIWPTDPLASGLIPFFVTTITLVMITVGISSGIIMRSRSISNEKLRRAVWAAILACVAFGPVVLVLSPAVIQSRISRNNRLAAERFAALRQAVESIYAEPDGPRKICNGPELRRRYSGPSFSDLDWRRITSNFVKQDGYFFMLFCHEKRGYTIAASPDRDQVDGTRQFCTDESGRAGCRVEWNRSRYACQPCPE